MGVRTSEQLCTFCCRDVHCVHSYSSLNHTRDTLLMLVTASPRVPCSWVCSFVFVFPSINWSTTWPFSSSHWSLLRLSPRIAGTFFLSSAASVASVGWLPPFDQSCSLFLCGFSVMSDPRLLSLSFCSSTCWFIFGSNICISFLVSCCAIFSNAAGGLGTFSRFVLLQFACLTGMRLICSSILVSLHLPFCFSSCSCSLLVPYACSCSMDPVSSTGPHHVLSLFEFCPNARSHLALSFPPLHHLSCQEDFPVPQ